MYKSPKRGERAFGQQQEKVAAAYLSSQGLTLVCMNYQCRLGEIDLIMRDKTTLIFVEVRYRRSSAYGSAAETVNYRKQRKLLLTAEYFLQSQPITQQKSCRFDVIGLAPDSQPGKLRYTWIMDAFRP